MEIKEAAVVECCPSCGRPMKVQLEYLGKDIHCGHCGGGCVVDVDQSTADVFQRQTHNRFRHTK